MKPTTPMPADELANELAGLRDIRLPDAVPLWPPAPGWWIALGFILATGIALALYVHARRRSLRVAALAELERLQSSFRVTDDVGAFARGVSALLRRTALARYGQRAVAGLHGPEWLEFLDSSAAPTGFPVEIGEAISVATYARPSTMEAYIGQADAWVATVQRWIRSLS